MEIFMKIVTVMAYGALLWVMWVTISWMWKKMKEDAEKRSMESSVPRVVKLNKPPRPKKRKGFDAE